jgi:hypothetical protein
MKILVWRSYSSNNSNSFRIISRFGSADKARAAGAALEAYFAENSYTLSDGSDDDAGYVEVIVAGSSVALYHDYTDDESFFDNTVGPREILEKNGGETGKTEGGAVTVQVFVKPFGGTGAEVSEELGAFFAQLQRKGKHRGVKPPWAKRDKATVRDGELLRFHAGEVFGYEIDASAEDIAWMREYYDERADCWMYLCEASARDKIQLLSRRPPCPGCNASDLGYIVADGETLAEDQLLCGLCGGMFTFEAISKALEAGPPPELPKRVLHKKFGEGVIIAELDAEKVEVEFDGVGKKLLHRRFVTPVGIFPDRKGKS